MDYRLDPLWLKLNMMNAEGMQAFAPIMKMIEQQMGTSAEMGQRVVEEYRKFLFLAMRAGHQVIPPGVINDVWMTAYAERSELLGKPWKNDHRTAGCRGHGRQDHG